MQSVYAAMPQPTVSELMIKSICDLIINPVMQLTNMPVHACNGRGTTINLERLPGFKESWIDESSL